MARSGTTRQRFTLGFPALAAVALATAAAAGASPAASGPAVAIRAFKPVADSYVTASHPRGNYGRSRILRVDGAPEATAYLRFELGKLTGSITGSITSVTLLLHPSTPARARFAVRHVNEDEWRERRLTYTNAPRPSSRYASSKPAPRGAWSAIDVTAFVDGEGEVSFAITTRAAKELSFGSRESRYGPRLVVRTSEDDIDDQVLEALLRR